jgi:hypothetical protein
MTRPPTPNIRRIAYLRECYQELETYLHEREMHQSHKEFLLDLAALTDFIANENYVGAHYLATTLNEKLKSLLPDWEKLARLHVPTDYQTPDIQHDITQSTNIE